MGTGTRSFGKRRNKILVRTHLTLNHLEKPLRRKTTGSGRMQYLGNVPRKYQSGFREEYTLREKSSGVVD
ncbi:hypothetical protein MKW94_008055 [Papaver nudicaule]|uniref:Uncharacterized protein n=1 Tax=Papaver nudicaule TaxID=74823 RepID=A0AA41UWE3_PAPNU|nr:hypothetical protein [Papaver nudicaule]